MTVVDLAAALGMGVFLGAITGMPLGVVNVAIVDAVIAREGRHALGIGIGGALADATHTLLAFAGLGRLVTARPQYARWLALAAAVAIIVFAVVSWRRRHLARSKERASNHDDTSNRDTANRHDANRDDDAAQRPALPRASSDARATSTDTGVARGVLSGIALTLPNPAALAAWVAVAAMTWPDTSVLVAVCVAIGVGVGSAAWFTFLGKLVAKVPPDHRALRIVPRVALALFVLIALGGAVRAF